jgi:hypothetical protein
MPEQQTNGFPDLAELDQWTNDVVIFPLYFGAPPDGSIDRSPDAVFDDPRRAIREKVVEVYRSGYKDGLAAAKIAGAGLHRPNQV